MFIFVCIIFQLFHALTKMWIIATLNFKLFPCENVDKYSHGDNWKFSMPIIPDKSKNFKIYSIIVGKFFIKTFLKGIFSFNNEEFEPMSFCYKMT